MDTLLYTGSAFKFIVDPLKIADCDRTEFFYVKQTIAGCFKRVKTPQKTPLFFFYFSVSFTFKKKTFFFFFFLGRGLLSFLFLFLHCATVLLVLGRLNFWWGSLYS